MSKAPSKLVHSLMTNSAIRWPPATRPKADARGRVRASTPGLGYAAGVPIPCSTGISRGTPAVSTCEARAVVHVYAAP